MITELQRRFWHGVTASTVAFLTVVLTIYKVANDNRKRKPNHG